MKSYTVKANRNIQIRSLLGFEGESQRVEYDFSPWEEDNGVVTSVEWLVKNGRVAVSNEALVSSVASSDISSGAYGCSLIKLTATAGNNVFVTHLRVVVKDPSVPELTRDYY